MATTQKRKEHFVYGVKLLGDDIQTTVGALEANLCSYREFIEQIAGLKTQLNFLLEQRKRKEN